MLASEAINEHDEHNKRINQTGDAGRINERFALRFDPEALSLPHQKDSRTGQPAWGRAILEAIRGTQQDFTSGSLVRAVALLSIPMVLEMLMQSVFEFADIFFVSRLGSEAVAAVGLGASLLIFVFATGIGLSMAVTAMVARRIGEKNPEAASAAAWQAILAGLAISIPFAIVGMLFAPDMLRLMGASEAVVEYGATYVAILFGSNVTILLLFLINAIFRGAGDAVLAMRALAIANLLNIALDPLFIFGLGPIPAMGITGAAIATALSRAVGVAYQLVALFRGSGRLAIRRETMRANREILGRMLGISGPGIVQYLVGSASWIAIIRLVAAFGSEAVAGYTIGVRVVIFAILPAWGMANAAATLTGQNLGAGQPDRAAKSVWITAIASAALLLLAGVALILTDHAIMRLFTDEPNVIEVGALLLKYLGLSYPFLALGLTMLQAFNGAGDTVTPTWINFFCAWVFQIPVALLLAHPLGLGAEGIFVSIAATQVVYAAVGIAWFQRGHWKSKIV